MAADNLLSLTFPGIDAGDYPMQEHCCHVEGYRMRYLRGGSGPLLVLLHGLLGYSFSWRLNFSALAQHFTVYAPDFLGVGGSERAPGADVSLAAAARRLTCFLDQQGISRCDLVGTSHGGAVAILMAAAQTQRFGKLVLVTPANPWSSHGRWIAGVLASAPGAALFRWLFPMIRRVGNRPWIARMYGDPRRLSEETLRGYAAHLYIPGTVEYGLSVVRTWYADLDLLKAALPRLKSMPTLLLWGDCDRTVYPSSAESMRALLPQSKLQFIAGTAHLPYEECPEEFNRLLLEFLMGRAGEVQAAEPMAQASQH